MNTTILVGYNTTGATSKWLIRKRVDGMCKACRFAITTRLDGSRYVTTEKEQTRNDLTDIHEESFDLS